MFVDVKQPSIKFRNNFKLNTSKLDKSINNNSNRLAVSYDAKKINKSVSSNSRSTSLNNTKIKTNIGLKSNYMAISVFINIKIQNILRISTPYISDDDKLRLEYKQNKSIWIVNNDFSKYIGKATISKPTFIPNYVSMTPSDPPLSYQFREIKKEKWVAKKNFKI